VANRQMQQLLLRVAKGDFARLEILRAMATAGSGRRIAPIRIGATSVFQWSPPHPIGRTGAQYPRWRRNGQVGDFHGKSTGVVNRA
jgi:hypothetical protein